jgi:hypothetical protein
MLVFDCRLVYHSAISKFVRFGHADVISCLWAWTWIYCLEIRRLIRLKSNGFWWCAVELKLAVILDVHTRVYVQLNWRIPVCWTYTFEYMCSWIGAYWCVGRTRSSICAVKLTHTGVLDVHVRVYVQLNWRIPVCWTYTFEYMCSWIGAYWCVGRTRSSICAVELTHTGALDVMSLLLLAALPRYRSGTLSIQVCVL